MGKREKGIHILCFTFLSVLELFLCYVLISKQRFMLFLCNSALSFLLRYLKTIPSGDFVKTSAILI